MFRLMRGKLSVYSGNLTTIRSTGGTVPGGRSTVWARAATLGVVLAATALLATSARAQVRAGGHALYKSQAFDGTFGAGARAEADLNFLRGGLVLAGLYDRLFPECEGCSSTELGAQLLFAPRQNPLYFGLGAGYRTDREEGAATETPGEWSYNMVAGLRLRGIPVIIPFVEFRQQFGSSLNEQTFAFGVLLSPTGSRRAPRQPFGS